MKFFQYKEDRRPVLIFTLYFIVDFIAYLYIDNIYLLVLWFGIGIIPKANIAAWNHHHQHLKTFKQTFLNRVLEVIYAFHTGITTNTWVLHHNFGHHLHYLDQEKDESRWMNKKGKKMNPIWYTIEVAFTAYYRALIVGSKYKKHRGPFLYMQVIVGILLLALFIYRPLPALFVYLLPMIMSLILTAWATYDHHSGLDTSDQHAASRNTESKWFNKLTGNLGYHTAHHVRFGLHWSKLPELHKELKDKIPPECIGAPNGIFVFLDKVDRLFTGYKIPYLQ